MSDYERQNRDNAYQLMRNMVDIVVESYQLSGEITSSTESHKSIVQVAEEFNITPLEVRKLLITGGAFETETSKKVNELYNSGKTVREIQKIMNLKVASVHSYLPYRRGIYNINDYNASRKKVSLYKERKSAVYKLSNAANEDEPELLWKVIKLFEGYPFRTTRKFKFTYKAAEDEMVINGEYKIPRPTIEKAYVSRAQLEASGKKVTGDAVMEDYIYTIFKKLNLK